MIGLLLFTLGLALLLVSFKFPHENTKLLWFRLLKTLLVKRSDAKFRVELPKRMDVFWKCIVEPRKLPIVLDERNEITLRASPWIGNRLEADVEMAISSTESLKEVLVRAVSPSFDVEETGEKLTLHLAMESETRYIVWPRTVGVGYIRFEFWQDEILRGQIEKAFEIRSKQYGVVLPARVTMFLTALGIVSSFLGGLLSVLKFIL